MKLRAGENRNGRSERDVATCMFLRHVRCCVSSHAWCRLVDMYGVIHRRNETYVMKHKRKSVLHRNRATGRWRSPGGVTTAWGRRRG